MFGGFGTWGHSRWTDPALKVSTPTILNPLASTVLLTNSGMPISWMITQFDPQLAFVRLGIFPKDKQNNFINKRAGDVFVMFPGSYNWRVDNVRTWTSVFSSLGFLKSEASCQKLQTFIDKVKFRGQIKFYKSVLVSEDRCFIDIKNEDIINTSEANKKIIDSSSSELNLHGFLLIKSSCRDYAASIGGQSWSYIFCSVSRD